MYRFHSRAIEGDVGDGLRVAVPCRGLQRTVVLVCRQRHASMLVAQMAYLNQRVDQVFATERRGVDDGAVGQVLGDPKTNAELASPLTLRRRGDTPRVGSTTEEDIAVRVVLCKEFNEVVDYDRTYSLLTLREPWDVLVYGVSGRNSATIVASIVVRFKLRVKPRSAVRL